MNAPRRWLDEGGGSTSSERDVLRSALSMDPPPDAQKQVWTAVLAQLPAAAGAAGAAGAAVKGAAAAKHAAPSALAKAAVVTKGTGAALAGAGILKSVLIGVGSAVAVLATYSAVAPTDKADLPASRPAAVIAPATPRPRGPAAPTPATPKPHDPTTDPEPTPAAAPERHAPDPQPAAPAPAGAQTAGPAGRAAQPAGGEPQGSIPGSPGAFPGGGGSPLPAAPETMAREESRMVGEAREALQRGDAAGALAQLGRIDQRFPGGVLGQEREALTIEALAKSGRGAEASARATAFLEAHPKSMLAGRVQPFVRGAAENGASPRAEPSPR